MSLVKRSIPIVLIALTIASLAWVWVNRQYIQDWQVVQTFTPTTRIASIPDRAGMSEKGKFLFYASQPVISEAAAFNAQCARRETSAAILGCFNGVNIYLYHVESEELDGITEVTAAHEMLHAAWMRMSAGEKKRLGVHLESVYDRIKTDETEERMAYYERQQPGERLNELHSILATEIAELDDTLERHYAQYFTNRQTVVALHDKYAAVFTALKDKSELLRQEIETFVASLNADITTHNAAVTKLEAEITAHNNRAGSIDGTNSVAVRSYNAMQAALMSRQSQLYQDEALLKQRQNEYKLKVQEYNQLLVRSDTLTDSIDSLKTPQSTAR